MPRRLARALALLLVLAPWPALADVSALYRAGDDRLTVEVADNGDARVEVGEFVYLRHGGAEYLTLEKFGGISITGRRDDMLKFLVVLFRADPQTAGLATPDPITPTVEPLPATEVLGLKGQGWRVWPKGKRDPAGSMDMACTDAPQLAPVGPVLQAMVGTFLTAFAPMDKGGHFRAILAVIRQKGAPLSVQGAMMGARMQLDRLETGRIDPERFAVPEDLFSAEMLDALAAQMKSDLAKGKTP